MTAAVTEGAQLLLLLWGEEVQVPIHPGSPGLPLTSGFLRPWAGNQETGQTRFLLRLAGHSSDPQCQGCGSRTPRIPTDEG